MLDKLLITHYCEKGKSPLHNITRLSKEDAFLMAAELSKNCKSERNRFGEDFIGYYPERLTTEEWLYESFLSLGGKPHNEHPIYFVLGESERLHQWFGNGDLIQIPLSEIASEYVSFTFGDSMSAVKNRNDKQVVRKEELLDCIEKSGLDISEFMNQVKQQYSYIEVQVWNDDCIQEYLKI